MDCAQSQKCRGCLSIDKNGADMFKDNWFDLFQELTKIQVLCQNKKILF
jgi:hypothetical protein